MVEFTRLLADKPIRVLDMPGKHKHKYMDPELVEMLKQSVDSILDLT